MPPPSPFGSVNDYYGSYGTQAPPQSPGVFGLGSTPGRTGPVEGIAQSVLPMVAEMLRNQFGGSVFTFGSDMNPASAKLAQQFLSQVNSAREFGARQDEKQVQDVMSGVARMLGHDMRDPEIQRAVGRLSGDLTQMLPVLGAMFPDQVDRWMPRGSLTVASASFVNAGRFVVDPATGLPVANDPGYAARVLGPLLADNAGRTAGLGAGRLGGIYEQLAGRGLIDGGTELRKLVESGGMTGAQAQDIQSDKVRATLERYSKAIGAVNDIFAEAGRPNTPTAELFAGLQKLTQGGAGMTAEQMASSVRRAQAIGQMTGMGVEAQAALGDQIAAGLQAGGQTANMSGRLREYSALMGRAYANRGLIFDGPEGQSMGEALARTSTLGVSGATSDYNNLIGAVLAMGDGAGGGPIKDLAAGIRAGKTTIDLPDGSRVDVRALNPEQINKIAVQSGLGVGALQQQLLAPNQIRGAINRDPGAVDRVTKVMQEEAAKQYFLGIAGYDPVMKGVNVSDLYDRLLGASANGEYTTDAEVVRAATAGMGLSSEQQSFVRTSVLGRMGGRFGLNEVNPYLRGDVERDERLVQGRANFADKLAGFGRGGFGRNLSSALAGYAGSLSDTALAAAGMVKDDAFKAALAEADPALLDYLASVYGTQNPLSQPGMAVGAGAASVFDQLGLGAAGTPISDMLMKPIRESGKPKMGDVVGQIGGAIGRGVAGPGGEAATNIDIKVARVVFEGGGMTVTGGGAVRGNA